MGRRSPNYHIEVDRKSESFRPGSVSSSDLSDTSSLGKKSSAPKVVAVIIVSLAIVAILVGVTVYLIDAEKAKQKIERKERIVEGIETEIDFGENAKAYIAEEIETTEKLMDLSNDVDIYDNLNRELTKGQLDRLKQISQRRRFLENFQKSKHEEYLRPTEEEKEFISSLIANRGPHLAVEQDLEFGGVGLFGNKPQSFPAVPRAAHKEREDSQHSQHDRAESSQSMTIPREDADLGPSNQDIYDMSSYLTAGSNPMMKSGRPFPRRNMRHRAKVLRPGLEGFRRNEPLDIDVLEPETDNVVIAAPAAANTETERQMVADGLATIDRRPGRPTFHHQGPPGGLRLGGRRRLRQRMGAQRDQLATDTFQKKMLYDLTAKKQDEILSNFDSFLKIAGSELGFLRNVAKNITANGKEVNLWEVLSAVNETVRKNPDSNIAGLMTKFEDKYLADVASKTSHPAQAVYERSLSSLLFLSMGIFLLNSVNELVDSGNLPNSGQSRAFPTNVALENLAKDSERHKEVFELFNSTAFDLFDHNEEASTVLELLKPTTPASTVNNYVRLIMNLMNAYMKDSSEFECIYAAYCYEVNQQAKLDGMASSVAKINSVGLRLALKELPSGDTMPALLQSLWSWQDLPCDQLFPSCDLGFTKVEKH